MRFSNKLLVAAAVVAMPAPANAGFFKLSDEEKASQALFVKCDGYSMPDRKSDGLTSTSWMFGLASVAADQRRLKTAFGADGVAGCDSALVNPRLQPQFVMRRANLLQAKAIHQIAAGRFEDALQTLAQSDATGASEPLFQESLGQGNRALRALADHGLGRKAEAEAALVDLERRRPYATSQQQLALRVRMQFEDERGPQITLLKRLASTFTPARKQLFWLSMLYRDFSGALSYAPGISFDDPRGHGGWQIEGGEYEKYKDVIARVEFAGAVAYAEFATGNKAVAAKTITTQRSDLEKYMQPPPDPGPDGQWSKQQRSDYEFRKIAGGKGLELLKDWEANIALRDKASATNINELPGVIKASGAKPFVPGDLIAVARTPEPKDSALQRELLADIDRSLDKERLKGMRTDFDDLVAMLPRPETLANRPRWEGEGDGFLRNNANGYAVQPNLTAGSFTVRFGTATGSLAMADEGAMLAAAYHARKQGRDAYVVDVRESMQRTIHTVSAYGRQTIAETPSGYEVRLIIRPISTASASSDDREHAIGADAVIAALAPKFTVATQ